MCVYVYLGVISSLIYVWLNTTDILCQHIFWSNLSCRRIDFMSILIVIILSIRSEEVPLFLVLSIHINTHNKMEINL